MVKRAVREALLRCLCEPVFGMVICRIRAGFEGRSATQRYTNSRGDAHQSTLFLLYSLPPPAAEGNIVCGSRKHWRILKVVPRALVCRRNVQESEIFWRRAQSVHDCRHNGLKRELRQKYHEIMTAAFTGGYLTSEPNI